ncbi:hypothetical protein NAU58_21075 [Pseudomonas stutzeri]|uniref:hypothetical protein n=1 Tax=Stutzerimonas stutzeri TaxID=316 RepID=UPI0021092651|nr:hypothetical protein [Stutzerimonas stutzeri]MCQ4298074.1 hypothetical protein [Stutzerimonas stutzeri]
MRLIPPRAEMLEVLEQATRELVVSFIVGGIPLLLFAPTSKALKELINASLTPIPLMKWYACLMIPLVIGALFAKHLNMRKGRSLYIAKWVFRVLSDIAGTMASAIQLALGAALGFLVTWQSVEPETLTAQNALGLIVTIVCMLFASVMFSLYAPMFRNPRASKRRTSSSTVWID